MNKRRLEAARIAASPIHCRGPSTDYVLRGKSNAIKVDTKLRSSAPHTVENFRIETSALEAKRALGDISTSIGWKIPSNPER